MALDKKYKELLRDAMRGVEHKKSPSADGGEAIARLLDPEKHGLIWKEADCSDGCGEPECRAACLFGAIERGEDGELKIDPSRCCGCAACIAACRSGALTASRDILPALYDIKRWEGPVYALVAPSFHGQFSSDVTAGKLRSAFLTLGFTEMVEVALFADVLTLKEALGFERSMRERREITLTSCCCPVWIAMIRTLSPELVSNVSGLVSPMIAAGRTVKAMHPDALTVFIGPCLAKKKEAREPELRGAVDWVLTFQELSDVFEAADLKPEELEETESGHASRAGRLYGRAGGVSAAVSQTARRLFPDEAGRIDIRRVDGAQACKKLLEELKNGGGEANYYEGMGCEGGCVGGPRAILDSEQGRRRVDSYGDEAEYATPLDNPYVDSILKTLGFDTVEEFLNESDIYSRDLTPKPSTGSTDKRLRSS